MLHSYVTWLTCMLRDSCICDMTHAYVTWLLHMRHISFIYDMTHSYVAWLIHMCRDSFICVMTHPCRDRLKWTMWQFPFPEIDSNKPYGNFLLFFWERLEWTFFPLFFRKTRMNHVAISFSFYFEIDLNEAYSKFFLVWNRLEWTMWQFSFLFFPWNRPKWTIWLMSMWHA